MHPAWPINPRRLIHNLLPPMTPLLKLFSNVVDLPLWTHTPKANHIVWAISISTNPSLWDTNYKKEGIMTMLKVNKKNERMQNRNNVNFKHDITCISYAHTLTTQSALFIIKELTYPVLYLKYLIRSLLMATFHHPSHFRRQSKIILLTKQLLLWR